MKDTITLTKHEIQCGSNRVHWAESLILQLPSNHDGRNSWLLNYGTGDEANKKRRKEIFEDNPIEWSEETDSLKPVN